MVVWNDLANFGSNGLDIGGGRVEGGTGAALDRTGFGIATNTGDQQDGSVAFAGNDSFLVVYQAPVQNKRRVLARFIRRPPRGRTSTLSSPTGAP